MSDKKEITTRPYKKRKTSTGGLVEVTPEQMDSLRRSVFDMVKKNTQTAREVLDGTRTWDAQQTRLFLALVNKVLPDLHFSKHEHEHREVTEMSEAELQQIASKGKVIEAEVPDSDPNGQDIRDAESDPSLIDLAEEQLAGEQTE